MNTGMYIGIICYLLVSTLCLLDIAGELKEIRKLMRQAADALDHFEKAFQSISNAPTIIPAEEGE